MMDPLDYLAENYFGEGGQKKVQNLMTYPNVYLMTSQVAEGAAAYTKLSDFAIGLLKRLTDERALNKDLLINLIVNHPGNNVFIFLLATNGYSTIRREFRNLVRKENPDKVMWFDPKTLQLQEHEVRKCQRV